MIGLLAWIPYFCGGVGNLAGGWFSSHLIRRGWGVDSARKMAFGLAVLLTATSGLIPFVSSAAAAMALICAAVLGINAFASTFMASLADIFPERAVARVAGITGLGDSSMSMFVMLATGAIVDRFSYLPIFISAACAPMLALAVIFLVVRRVEPCLDAR
jgi:ACS family hexuronate transporter-like MFS transporter